MVHEVCCAQHYFFPVLTDFHASNVTVLTACTAASIQYVIKTSITDFPLLYIVQHISVLAISLKMLHSLSWYTIFFKNKVPIKKKSRLTKKTKRNQKNIHVILNYAHCVTKCENTYNIT